MVRVKSFWPYGLIALTISLFYYQILFVQGAWLVGDHTEQHYPWAYFYQHVQ